MYCNVTGEYTYFLYAFQFCIKHGTKRSITTASRSTTAATTPPIIAAVFEGWKGVSVAGFMIKVTEKRTKDSAQLYILYIVHLLYLKTI